MKLKNVDIFCLPKRLQSYLATLRGLVNDSCKRVFPVYRLFNHGHHAHCHFFTSVFEINVFASRKIMITAENRFFKKEIGFSHP